MITRLKVEVESSFCLAQITEPGVVLVPAILRPIQPPSSLSHVDIASRIHS